MQELKVFENEEIGVSARTMLNDDGSISVNAEDTAIGFGWTQEKNGKMYVKWERINGYLEEFGFSKEVGKNDYIPESLFYRLGMKASNARAEKFQNWLAVEVIPSIRKNGGYISGQETLSNDELLEKAILVAQRKIAEREKIIQDQHKQIEEMKLKTNFFDAVANSKDAIEMGQVAKVLNYLGIGRNKLFEVLRDNGVLRENNEPYQKYIDNGCFRTIEQKYSLPDGSTRINIKTLVYQKGVEYIRKILEAA